MHRVVLAFSVLMLIGCESMRYQVYASRIGVQSSEVSWIAKQASDRYRMFVIGVYRDAAGDIEVHLGERKDASSGLVAVFRKTESGWREVEPTPEEQRVWDRLEGPNQPPQRNAGSCPSSNDSPASETPSSLGPRG